MRLLTLGGLKLEGSGFTRPKPLLLLTYLALEGPRHKPHLAELFWPRAKSASHSLEVALTQLRRGAPGCVEVDGTRVATSVGTDAQAFVERLEAGDVAGAEDRYGGPFLAGVRLRWGVELEEWVVRTRELLAGHAREALLQRAEADGAQDRFREAAGRAERAYALPGADLPEPGELERIHDLLRAGNSARATAVREEAEGFGLDLAGSTEEARRRVGGRVRLADDATTDRVDLPGPHGSFVGREREANALIASIRSGVRLVSVLGPPGVGKTRLALHCARRLERSGELDRVLFVDLGNAGGERQMLLSIAAAARTEEAELDGSVEQIVRFVERQRVLLVLDGFEHLVASADRLAELSRRCPRLHLLITSRERLNLSEEQGHVVRGLAVPAATTPADEARTYAAVELFVQRAWRARPGFALDDDTLPAVVEICRLVDGLPLGLEIAAAWLRMMPAQAIADELSDGLDLLESSLRDVPERHRSVRAAIAASWNLLTPRQRTVLARLGVFRGDFARDAAAAVAHATIPALAALIDASLVRLEGPDRYALHPLVAQYARERLAEDPDGERCRRRHAEHHLALAQRAEPHLTGPEPAPWLRRLERAHDDLRAAFDHFHAVDVERAMRLADAMWRFWIIRGHNREGRDVLTRLLDESDASPPGGLRARLLRALGTLTFQSGDFVRSEPVLEEALRVAREQADEHELATALTTLGWVAVHLGRTRTGRAFCLEALRLHRRLGDRRGAALARNDLGFRSLFLGSLHEAKDHLRASLRTFEALGDERGVAHLSTNLAIVHGRMGRYEDADTLLERAIRTHTRIGDRQLLVWALYQRATLALARERDAEAAADLREALPMARDVGNRELLGAVFAADADRSLQAARTEEAELRLEEAHGVWRSAGYPWMWAATHRVAARLALARGRADAARGAIRESFDLADAIGDRLGIAEDAEALTWLAAEGDPEGAARVAAVAEALRSEIGAPLPPRFVERHAERVEAARAAVGDDRFAHAWRSGRDAGIAAMREAVGKARFGKARFGKGR